MSETLCLGRVNCNVTLPAAGCILSASPSPTISGAINPAVGTLSAAGLYSAPASVTALQQITVTATAQSAPRWRGAKEPVAQRILISCNVALGEANLRVAPSPISLAAAPSAVISLISPGGSEPKNRNTNLK